MHYLSRNGDASDLVRESRQFVLGWRVAFEVFGDGVGSSNDDEVHVVVFAPRSLEQHVAVAPDLGSQLHNLTGPTPHNNVTAKKGTSRV